MSLVDAAHGKVTALGTRAKNAIAAFLELMDGLRVDAAEATNAITGLPPAAFDSSRTLVVAGPEVWAIVAVVRGRHSVGF